MNSGGDRHEDRPDLAAEAIEGAPRPPGPPTDKELATIWQRILVAAVGILAVATFVGYYLSVTGPPTTSPPTTGCGEPGDWVYSLFFSWFPAFVSVWIMVFAAASTIRWIGGRLMTSMLVVAVVLSELAVSVVGVALESNCVTSDWAWTLTEFVMPAAIAIATVLVPFLIWQRRIGRSG